MDEKAQTRERILHAAMTRIKHYGYGKTTMAEIAADCGMSPGNIYRFFEAKIDIAEAMARRHYAEQQLESAAIARQRDLKPDERLRALFMKRMRDNYLLVEENAKVLEVAEVLSRERPIFSNEQLAHERVFLAALLEEGAEKGVFIKGDYGFIAEMLQSATAKFSFPQLFSQLSLAKLERELNGVLDLVLNGLYVRVDRPNAEPVPAREAITTS
jgi:AcrR family transcriptional regulator